jgi:hypothetical protein
MNWYAFFKESALPSRQGLFSAILTHPESRHKRLLWQEFSQNPNAKLSELNPSHPLWEEFQEFTQDFKQFAQSRGFEFQPATVNKPATQPTDNAFSKSNLTLKDDKNSIIQFMQNYKGPRRSAILQIANQYGLSETAVMNWLAVWKAITPPWLENIPPNTLQSIISDFRNGLSISDVSQKYNLNARYVQIIKEREGIMYSPDIREKRRENSQISQYNASEPSGLLQKIVSLPPDEQNRSLWEMVDRFYPESRSHPKTLDNPAFQQFQNLRNLLNKMMNSSSS